MNLFIDAVSTNWVLILFDDKRNIISKKEFFIKWNESFLLVSTIDNFLKENNVKYKDLINIIVVNWPWSFTWIRTIILTVNTINYINNNFLTDLSYFDLFDNYPIIKQSSKKDYFIKKTKSSQVEIIDNKCLFDYFDKYNIWIVFGDINNEVFTNVKILDKIDYSTIIKNIKFKKLKKLDALYIKKPNIS